MSSCSLPLNYLTEISSSDAWSLRKIKGRDTGGPVGYTVVLVCIFMTHQPNSAAHSFPHSWTGCGGARESWHMPSERGKVVPCGSNICLSVLSSLLGSVLETLKKFSNHTLNTDHSR